MQALANVIAKYDLPVINDELYSEMELDGRPHISLASLTADTPQGKKRLYDLALTVTGTSKLFNLSEDKAGLACSGNRQWIKQIQEAIRKDGLPFLKERALKAEAIIRHTTEAYKQESRRFHQELRDKFVEDIRQANHHLGADMIQLMASPEAGYYGCLTLEPSLCERYGITTSAQLGEYLYMVAGIITIPLSTMGTDQIGVRINLGGDTDIEDIKRRLKQVEVAVSRMENMARKMIDGTAPTYAYVAEQIEKQLSVQKTEDKTASRFA
jgi:aspartate/methionine/tyrosine aminotransferase